MIICYKFDFIILILLYLIRCYSNCVNFNCHVKLIIVISPFYTHSRVLHSQSRFYNWFHNFRSVTDVN